MEHPGVAPPTGTPEFEEWRSRILAWQHERVRERLAREREEFEAKHPRGKNGRFTNT